MTKEEFSIQKKPTCRTDFSAAQIGSMNFQRYFFPLDGAFFSDTIHLKKIKFQRNIKLFFLFFRTSIRYKIKPKKIVYISCNPATLIRDLAFFEEYYDIKTIVPVDMFPFTSNVECVTVLYAKETL